VILFVGIVVWVYRPKNRKRFEDAARIPFKEGNGD
jgi:cbb3-type cytochrome oxidase subunit 3